MLSKRPFSLKKISAGYPDWHFCTYWYPLCHSNDRLCNI